MGEANKAYVNQEYDEAIRLCQHVLTQYPYSPEPYTTLAMVHHDRGDIRTALEFRKLEAVRCKAPPHLRVALWPSCCVLPFFTLRFE